jgi:FkbM family methyltransferase
MTDVHFVATALYEVFITGEYALLGVSEPPAFIIDGGANVGMASLYFLGRYPAARVIAVEPDPANFEICCRNLRPYGDRVNVIQGAIWETEGRLGLKQNPNGDEWCTEVRDDNAGPVKALTMPWLLAQSDGQIGLLKLDIEGSEAKVFAAGTEKWLPWVRNIAIELHGDERKACFLAALGGYDYDLSIRPTWTGLEQGAQRTCYLAICSNLKRQSAVSCSSNS